MKPKTNLYLWVGWGPPLEQVLEYVHVTCTCELGEAPLLSRYLSMSRWPLPVSWVSPPYWAGTWVCPGDLYLWVGWGPRLSRYLSTVCPRDLYLWVGWGPPLEQVLEYVKVTSPAGHMDDSLPSMATSLQVTTWSDNWLTGICSTQGPGLCSYICIMHIKQAWPETKVKGQKKEEDSKQNKK